MSNALPSTNAKQRSMMIIISDDDMIDHIEKTNDAALLKKLVFESEIDNEQISKTKSPVEKTKSAVLTCVVCESPAHGYNLGAIVCESCKAFFRRNSRKDSALLRCRYKRSCDVNSETRRYCPACRLAKCYEKGMRSDRILTDEQKAVKRRKLEENRNLTLKTNTPSTQTSSPTTQSVNLDTPNVSSASPKNPLKLTSEELKLIEEISAGYQEHIDIPARKHQSDDSMKEKVNFIQIVNSYSESVIKFLTFFKQIPEFNQLNIDDRVILTKYNLVAIAGISHSTSCNSIPHNFTDDNFQLPWHTEIYKLVFGYKFCEHLRKILDPFIRIAGQNPKIVQLFLVILILTKGFSIDNSREPILNNEIAVHRVQNNYTELLWKYLEYTYGFEESVRFYGQLIGGALSWQTIQDQMRSSILRALSPQDIEKLQPILKSIWYMP